MPKTKEPQPAVEHADDIEYRQRIESDVAGLKQQISELRRELGLSVRPPQPPVAKPPAPNPLLVFTEKHGGRGAMVDSGDGRRIFPDGAEIRMASGGLYQLMEPPADPWELLRLKRRYVQAKHEHAQDAFYKLQDKFQSLANDLVAHCQPWAHPTPLPTDWRQQLEARESEIDALSQQLADIDRQLAEDPAVLARTEAQADIDQRRSAAMQVAEGVKQFRYPKQRFST